MLVGIDIGGTKTAVALAEHPDCILYRQEFPTLPNLGPEHVGDYTARWPDFVLHLETWTPP